MSEFKITVEGRTFDVRLLSDPRQARVEVEVDGQVLTVEVMPGSTATGGDDEQEEFARPPAPVPVGGSGAGLAGGVVAPLPGTVKSIAVAAGQRVALGDTLLVIEAMKMDNAIRASRPGVVAAIHVAAGQRVAHGEPLLTFRE